MIKRRRKSSLEPKKDKSRIISEELWEITEPPQAQNVVKCTVLLETERMIFTLLGGTERYTPVPKVHLPTPSKRPDEAKFPSDNLDAGIAFRHGV